MTKADQRFDKLEQLATNTAKEVSTINENTTITVFLEDALCIDFPDEYLNFDTLESLDAFVNLLKTCVNDNERGGCVE